MSQFDKLIKKVLSLSREMRFDELQKILKQYGYEMKGPHNGSSHYTFRKSGQMPITIPKNNPIKIDYVKMIKEIIENEQNN